MRESWLTFEGKEFHFLLAAEIVAYDTRAVSWPMFSPLSVTKWPTYHTFPSKFASNREILFCANEPKKTGKSIEIGGEYMNFEAFEHSNLMHFVPFSSVGAMEPCLRPYCNLL